MRILLTAGGVAALLLGFEPTSTASPALAYSSDDADYAQDVCRQRASTALAPEGWEGVHPSGNPPLAVAASKGPLAAVILCVDRAIGADHSIAVIFVTGGENGQPDAERDRLEHYMKD